MKSSCEQVFEIPELVLQVTARINKKTMATLMATCRLIHNACEPSLYNTLDVYYKPFVSPRINTLASLTALERNSRHVRHLKTGLVFTAYLCEAQLAHQELQQHNSGCSSSSSPFSSQPTRPLWLPRIDDPCLCVPLPPLRNLMKLSGSFYRTAEDESDDESEDENKDECEDQDEEDNNNNKLMMPIPKDYQTCLAQMCWLIGQSPWLSTLTLTHYWISCKQDVQLLATTIAGASNLERLALELIVPNHYLSPRLRQAIFCSAPTSLRQLSFTELGPPAALATYEAGLVEKYRGKKVEDDEDEVDLEPYKRQGPLPHLVELHFSGDFGFETPEFITMMLDRCPALVSLIAPNLRVHSDAELLARRIAEYCPQIRRLTVNRFSRAAPAIVNFISALMNALPEHTMESLCFPRFYEQRPEIDSARMFQRHSLTIRKIDFMGCFGIEGATVRTILQKCKALESLFVWNPFPVGSISIDLEDAVAAIPWACTGIKELRLVVKIHELYRTMGTNEEYQEGEIRPYYERPAPTYITDFEMQQFALLERLFRQIGQLSELENLGLQSEVIPEGFDENDGTWGMDTYFGESFPAMLSLGDKEAGRPGFLGHFAGLTKLKIFSGSVEVGDKENSAIVGLKEANWFAEHLPCLEEVHFYNVDAPFPIPARSPAMEWLQKQRPSLKMSRVFN